MSKASSLLLILLFPALGISCARKPSIHWSYHPSEVSRSVIDQVINVNPLSPEQNIRATPLAETDSTSHMVVQIRYAEALHIHRTHDLCAIIHLGRGKMVVGKDVFVVEQGDIVLVPKGVPHRFINLSKSPAVAVVIFTPKLAGQDNEPVSE